MHGRAPMTSVVGVNGAKSVFGGCHMEVKRCLICETRPRKRGSNYCPQCAGKVARESRKAGEPRPEKYMTYRGYVVGLWRKDTETLTARAVQCDAETLPKSRTIDLNTFLDGYDAHTIKSFKATVLSLNHA